MTSTTHPTSERPAPATARDSAAPPALTRTDASPGLKARTGVRAGTENKVCTDPSCAG